MPELTTRTSGDPVCMKWVADIQRRIGASGDSAMPFYEYQFRKVQSNFPI